MSVSRRQLLGGAALLGAAGAIGLHRMAVQQGRAPELIIFDSRKPASLAFARSWDSARLVDLAGESTRNWNAIRAIRRPLAVAGLTSWNDYVWARQWLQERGLRVASEDHDRRHDLIAWAMG